MLIVLAATSVPGQDSASAPHLNAPGPRIFRLPPVEEPSPTVEQQADPSDVAEPSPSASPEEKTQPSPPPEEVAKPEPEKKKESAEKGEGKEDKDKKEKEDDEDERPVGIIANSHFLPDAFREYWKQWDASLEFGMQGTEGNSTTYNMRVGGQAERKTDIHRHTIKFTHIDNSKQHKKTALSTLIDARWERMFGKSRWSYFAHSLTEFDEFKAFDVRISADTGLGFEWFKTDDARLLTRLGGSASREVGGPNNGYTPEISSGIEWKHKLSERQNVFAQVDYFPDVTDLTDFRLNSRAEWEMIVSRRWGLSLKMSVIDRYDSTPEGARPNDLNYSFLMLWAL